MKLVGGSTATQHFIQIINMDVTIRPVIDRSAYQLTYFCLKYVIKGCK